MARFEFKISPIFIKRLERLENFDEVAEEMLNAATPILEKYVKHEVAKHKDQGDLLKSIRRQKKPKKNNKGVWSTSVLPTGEDKHGVRNMAKLAHLEYGWFSHGIRDKDHYVPATPIITKAMKEARGEVNEKMLEVFEKWVTK